MCLLVIETDMLFRENLARHLRQRGYTVRTACNQQEIARILAQKDIAVVLLGLGGLGRDALKHLKFILECNPATKVILLSTPELLHYSIEGMKLGAFDEMLVPYDIDLLCARIRQAKSRQAKSNPDQYRKMSLGEEK